jgi:hypothetical protein
LTFFIGHRQSFVPFANTPVAEGQAHADLSFVENYKYLFPAMTNEKCQMRNGKSLLPFFTAHADA